MNKYLVRFAKAKDIISINRLSKEMHRHLGNIVGLKFSDKNLEEENVTKSELGGIIIAEDFKNNKIVGYISFSTKPLFDEWYGKHLYIFEIGVSKTYRGGGIGTSLINAVISMAKKKNLNIKIDTLSKNKKTAAFYKKLGFSQFMTYFILENKKRLKL